MKYSSKSLLYQCAVLMLAAAITPHDLSAQNNFVYTNDDQPSNTVSGFSVGPNGALTPVPGSPFLTGGHSNGGGGLPAANRITVSATGRLLFAANTHPASISVFTIDPDTGALTLVPESPFALPFNLTVLSLSLAATPDGHFLMAANSNSDDIIAVFSIGSNGALSPIASTHALNPVSGIRVSPDGKFLAVAEIPGTSTGVEMFSIASNGSLTSLGATHGHPQGLDMNCSSSVLYAGEPTNSSTIVDAYDIGANGTLTPLAGSPFEPGVGTNSNVVLLGANDKTLFVSNQFSNTITAFNVAANGSLSLTPGSPFPMKGPVFFPSGMATSEDGSFLYVANREPSVSVFRVGSNGALTEVAGSPFSTGRPAGLLSLAAFPPKPCSLPVNIEIKPPALPPVPINTGAKGKIPVAILSTLSFDAVTQVDPKSLTFGRTGNEASLARCGAEGQDVNNDGLPDLVCQFNTPQTGLVAGDHTAVVKGKTVDGRTIQGSEAIRTVPR
jgi:6-phosphogluconolactonase (cycloisomerase 2 family)